MESAENQAHGRKEAQEQLQEAQKKEANIMEKVQSLQDHNFSILGEAKALITESERIREATKTGALSPEEIQLATQQHSQTAMELLGKAVETYGKMIQANELGGTFSGRAMVDDRCGRL